LGLSTPNGILLSVWRRGGPSSVKLPIKALQGRSNVQVELLYPTKFQAQYEWTGDALSINLEADTAARLFRLRST
jgi:alpha-galactosidase